MLDVAYRLGTLRGKICGISDDEKSGAELEALVSEAMAPSAIEGELLERASVRSSAARRLGMDQHGLTGSDRRIDGLVEMLQDAVILEA